MFSQVSVCSEGVGISGPCPFQGICQGVFPGGGYLQRVGGYSPPQGWVCPGGWVPTTPMPMGPGMLWDMVDKRVVRILLECFLV